MRISHLSRLFTNLLVLALLICAFLLSLFPVHHIYTGRRFVLVGFLALALPALSYWGGRTDGAPARRPSLLMVSGAIVFIAVAWATWWLAGARPFAADEVFLYSFYLATIVLAGWWLAGHAGRESRPQVIDIVLLLTAGMLAYGLLSVPFYLFMLADRF